MFVGKRYSRTNLVPHFSPGSKYLMVYYHEFGKLENFNIRGLGDFTNCIAEIFLSSIESSGSNPKPGQFRVPHSLALVPHLGQLCVADRENGRIQCFKTDTKEFVREIKHASFGRNVFAISYIPGISSLFVIFYHAVLYPYKLLLLS